MANVDDLRGFINKIHAVNTVACNVPQVLDSLDITVSSVPTINLYLFELVQNALDAGADSIEVQVTGLSAEEMPKATESALKSQRLVFLHNGPGGLGKTDQHVRGMSNVFQSTKSVGSVGFMGFGFKTLYKRFASVSVSDCNGWKFGFDVPEKIVALHPQPASAGRSSPAMDIVLKTRGWIGAVCPTWDDSIAAPDGDSFSTKFELSQVVSATFGHLLMEDVNEALFSGGMTALAVLGSQGLRKLKIIDTSAPSQTRLFELVSLEEKSVMVTQIAPKRQEYHWKCLRSQYEPGIEETQAIAQARLKNILQHHKDMEKVISEIRRPYRVLGLIPISPEDGLAQANRGQLFATLPIRSFVPFGISIQADWLLDLSRKGLRDVETNPWQQLIVRNVAKLVAIFIASIRSTNSTVEAISRSFAVLGSGIDSLGNLDTAPFSLERFGNWIREELSDTPVFPVLSPTDASSRSASEVEWRPISQVVLLPHTHYRPHKVSNLIGFAAIDESLVTPSTCQFFVQIGLLKPLNIQDIITKFSRDGGIGEWYNSLDKSEASRRESLVELWAFLAEFAPAASVLDLKCIPAILASKSMEGVQFTASTSSTDRSLHHVDWLWTSPAKLTVFDHASQYRDLPDDQQALKFIANSISPDTLLLPPTFLNFLLQKSGDWNGPGRVAFEWVSRYWSKKGLKQFAKRSFMNASVTLAELADGAAIMDRFEQGTHKSSTLGGLLTFSKWAVNSDLSDLISHLLPSQPADSTASSIKPVDAELLVIGAPFAESELALIQPRLFSKWRTIHPIYASLSLLPQHNWSTIFAKLGAKGAVVLEEIVIKTLGVHPSYIESRKGVADILEISHDAVLDFQTTSRNGWKIVDTVLKDADFESRPEIWPYLATWLEANIGALERADSMLVGQGVIWRTFTATGKAGTASWCKLLNRVAWVPQLGTQERVRPFEVRRECVALTAQLIQVLEKKGVYFGRTSAQKQVLDRIASFGSSEQDAVHENLEQFAADLLEVSSADPAQHPLIVTALRTSEIPITLMAGVASKEGCSMRRVKIQELVLLDTDELTQDISEVTLNNFLVSIHCLAESIQHALLRLHDLGIVTIPSWPTADQALRYFRLISSEDGKAYRSANTIPSMLEYLSADQSKLRNAFLKESSALRLSTPSSAEWVSLDAEELKNIPKSSCGLSPRVQKLVKNLILKIQKSTQ